MDTEKQTFKHRFKSEILDKLSVRRILIYCLGFFLIAIGISISAKSSLGVSPVNSVPYTVSLFFVAVRVFMYVNSDFLPLPSEGVMLTFSKRTKLPFHICKIGFDCAVVVIAAAVSFISKGELLGVREGTVIAAVFVGVIIKPVSRLFLEKLKRFIAKKSI